jgi:hypothetical protein
MADVSEHLRDPDRALWATYQDQEARGLRKQALATLREIVDAIRAYPPERRTAWVETICADHWRDAWYPWFEGRLTLRNPLLVDVILPELLEGYEQQRPNSARWLALFSLTSTGNVNAEIYDELRLRGMPEWYPVDALREAIALDPLDRQAAHALIRHLEATFDYATHEVPRGVLIDDTEIWRRELDEFEGLIERYPTDRDYSFELAGWRLHCDAWPKYLERRDEFASYAEFLGDGEPE